MNYKLKLIIDFICYKVRRPHRNGHGIHSPFLFDFVTQVLYKNKQSNDTISSIKAIRRNLQNSNETIAIEDYGAGSAKIAGTQRKISDIARYSSTSAKYGQLLYDIVSYLQPETIIELGTCLGIGTMYLASGHKGGKVYTIEGSTLLFHKAQENCANLAITNIIPKQGNFDDVLPVLLKENGKFDLIYIDGNHTKEATIRYFKLCLAFAKSHSVIIFDDIRWSDEMLEAWREICGNEKVKISLDLFKLGIVFFNDKFIKQNFELYY